MIMFSYPNNTLEIKKNLLCKNDALTFMCCLIYTGLCDIMLLNSETMWVGVCGTISVKAADKTETIFMLDTTWSK